MPSQVFLRKVFIEERDRAIEMAMEHLTDLTLWCDGSKLDQEGIGVAVV